MVIFLLMLTEIVKESDEMGDLDFLLSNFGDSVGDDVQDDFNNDMDRRDPFEHTPESQSGLAYVPIENVNKRDLSTSSGAIS